MDAAVDVGTNTVRLLLGEAGAGRVEPVRYFRRITRLGGGASPQRGLAPEAMERTLRALGEAANLIAAAGAGRVRAVGTAALRAAANAPLFVERARAATGLRLEVIAGDEEARLCARGVLSALEPRPCRALIFDLGGGSTEFILWDGRSTAFHRSYPLGVVDLCEKWPEAGAQRQQIATVLDALAADLAVAGLFEAALAPDCPLVGTAGTVTTLAALELRMRRYDWRRVNNLVLAGAGLRSLAGRLEGLSVAAREALPGMEAGRGDLIVPGLRIVLSLLERFGKSRLTVSDFGLLEGVLLNLAEGAH